MSGYIVAMIDVKDMEQYKNYMALTPAIIEKYGGKFLTRGGQTQLLEGKQPGGRMVLLEFPTYQAALDFYNSPEYQAAIKVREGAAEATFMALEGL